MLYLLFPAFGVLFWLLLLLSSCVAGALLYNKERGWCAFLVIAFAASILAFSDLHPIDFVSDHPFLTLLLVLGYPVAGVLTMFFEWKRYCSNHRFAYDQMHEEYVKNTRGYPTWKSYFKELGQSSSNYRNGTYIEYQPDWRDHKADLISWGSYWPLTFAIFICTDLLHDFFMRVLHYFGGVFDKMMKSSWKGTENDFNSQPKEQS